jgi:two-component system, NarL family, nitrate/nitrite response regulator NarL
MSLTKSNVERISKADHSPEPILRALIADRDAMSSHLLAEVLRGNRSFDTAAILASDLIRTLSTRETDLVIISADLHTGPGDGFELAQAVHRARPEIIIILLLKQADHESIIYAFRSGARAVFSRQSPMSELLDCIDHVKKGYLWAGKEETNSLLSVLKSIPVPAVFSTSVSHPLTKRELQVVRCAARGKTNRAIADELDLSEHTVKNYLFRAFEKLGVSSRTELLFRLTVGGHTLVETSKCEPACDRSPALEESPHHRLISRTPLRSGNRPAKAISVSSLIGSA